jgi:hypothetical protein
MWYFRTGQGAKWRVGRSRNATASLAGVAEPTMGGACMRMSRRPSVSTPDASHWRFEEAVPAYLVLVLVRHRYEKHGPVWIIGVQLFIATTDTQTTGASPNTRHRTRIRTCLHGVANNAVSNIDAHLRTRALRYPCSHAQSLATQSRQPKALTTSVLSMKGAALHALGAVALLVSTNFDG